MNKAVPWSIKGVDFNAREAAKEAARRSGMTLGEWLNSVIADQAEELGIDPEEVDDNQKVEAVSRRLARMAPDSGYRQEPRQESRQEPRQERSQRQESRQEQRQDRSSHPREARFREESDDQEARWGDRRAPRRRYVDDEDFDRDTQPEERSVRAARYEPRQNAYRQEPYRQEAYRQESPRQESLRQELHQEPLRQDAARPDSLYVVNARDLGSPREAEALLDDAIRGFERGTRRYQVQTNATLDKFSRRLAELESHLNQRAERAAVAREDYRERRAAPAMPRNEESADIGGGRSDYFAEIDRKLSQLVERMEGPKAVPADPNMQRIEEKLNALLNRPLQPAEPSVAAGPRHATTRPPSRLALSDALSQIARRQRDLDQQPEPAPTAPAPMRYTEPRPDGTALAAQEREASALRGDIAALSQSLEALRRDMKERESAQAAALAAAPSVPSATTGAIDQLRQQIAEMNTVVATLPQRESFTALEAATRDLISRVETSRQEGVRENILQPIEALVEHIQRILTEFSPRATIDAIKREIGVIAESVGSVGNKGVDAATLTGLNEQTREIRELLKSAADRPMPIENIERQIADLARRVDLIAQRGSTKLGSDAVSESVQAIRQTVESVLPTSLLQTLEQRVETLGRKIDEAVNQEQAPVETRALEDMMRDIAARLDRPQAPVVGDFSQLEESVRELARRVDTAGRPGAPSSAFNALEEQIARLASRLDQSDASLGRLPDVQRSLGEIVGLIEQNRSQAIDAAEQAARTAAREAMNQIGAMTGAADPVRGQIANEIAGLRDGQEAMDRRTRATLTAVHETLEKVVDRLALIEGGYQPIPAAAPVPETKVAKEPEADVPPEADADLLASGPAPSFVRAGAPQLQTGEPTAEGLRRQVSADDIMRASGTRASASVRPAPEPAVTAEDVLLEPGSGAGPRKGGPAARHAAAPAVVELDPQDEPGLAQQSFIAAARRARETAVADAQVRAPRGSGDDALAEARARAKAAAAALAAEDDGSEAQEKGLGPFGRARAFISQRKRPILLSLAGIVLALGALTVVRSMYEEAPPARQQVGAVAPREPAKIQTQAQPIDKSRTNAGMTAPVTANELAALGNKFVQEPPTLERKPLAPPVAALQPPSNTDAAPVGSIGPSTKAPEAKGQDLRAAATAGDGAAQYELAARLFEGRTVPRDLAQSAQWFEKAALQDLAPAQYRLGSLYEKGVGVARDTTRAKTLYQRAADRGNIRAMHNLAVLYAEGVDGKPDYAAAAQWFRKASEYGVRDSQYNLAILYARGLGIGQDLSQSWIWFSLAAAQGDEDAGKKRADVAARLNAQQLASAKATVDGFKPKTGETAANEVALPPGGWELAAPVAKPESSVMKPEKRGPSAAPARPKLSTL